MALLNNVQRKAINEIIEKVEGTTLEFDHDGKPVLLMHLGTDDSALLRRLADFLEVRGHHVQLHHPRLPGRATIFDALQAEDLLDLIRSPPTICLQDALAPLERAIPFHKQEHSRYQKKYRYS